MLGKVGGEERRYAQAHIHTQTPRPADTSAQTHKHVPVKGNEPEAAHEQGGMALCDVGAKACQNFPEQVNDLQDLLLGRKGGGKGGRHGGAACIKGGRPAWCFARPERLGRVSVL